MSKAARRGKIFIDYLRNERGATSVVAYSSRAKLGAAVSTPIAWEELSKLKSAKQFTIENLPARLRSRKSDPWKDLPNIRQALTQKRKKLLGLK
jgi:bifunctional non-homologous end joining protein LigD